MPRWTPAPAAGVRAEPAAAARQSRDRSAANDFSLLPGTTPTPTPEPLWQQIFTPERQAASHATPPPALAAELRRSATVDSFDWGAAGNIRIDIGPAQKPKDQPELRRKRIWVWQAVEGLLLSRVVSGALAVAMILLFVSTLDVPWSEWLNKRAEAIKAPFIAAAEHLSQPIRQRAAFFINDDFSDGADPWQGSRSVEVDPAGWLKIGAGVALRRDTVNLKDYRLDFDAKIQSHAVGWAVRAPDERNFYGFKMIQAGSQSAPTYSLARYAMIDGAKTLMQAGIEVPSHLARSDDFNRISVRVVGDHVTTLVNGWGVDYWRDDQLEAGGVGLVADAGESALVRQMTISGNDDTWGLILYGTLETIQSVADAIGSSPTAAIVFYRPIIVGSADKPLLLAASR